MTRLPAVFLLTTAVALPGCHSMPSNPLSTSAAMIVEVDVYKGPLSRSRHMQLGELFAIVQETRKSLETFHTTLNDRTCEPLMGKKKAMCLEAKKFRAMAVSLLNNASEPDLVSRGSAMSNVLGEFSSKDGQSPEDSNSSATQNGGQSPGVSNSSATQNGGQLCGDSGTPAPQAQEAQINGGKWKHSEQAMIEASEFATRMKAAAFYWAEVQTADRRITPDERFYLIQYTNLLSEYSNQIVSRVNALDRQIGTPMVDSKKLPLSVHLGDTGPTDFLELFEWYRARSPAPEGRPPYCDSFSSPDWPCFTPDQPLSVSDQVRLAKRLFADHYWTKINEVYASGQGDVRMALIKDDIGNWNLKSFDNDPSKLLDAYRQANLASIKLGERLARKVVEEGSTAGALTVLGQLAEGRFGREPRLGTRDLDVVHQDTLSELRGVLMKVQESGGEIANNCTYRPEGAEEVSIHKAVDTAREALDKAKKKEELDKAKKKVDSPEAASKTSPPTQPAAGNDTSNNQAKAVNEVEMWSETLHKLEDMQTACLKAAQEYHAEARQIVTNHRRVLEVLQKLQPVEPAPASKAGSNAATTAAEAARGAAGQ